MLAETESAELEIDVFQIGPTYPQICDIFSRTRIELHSD